MDAFRCYANPVDCTVCIATALGVWLLSKTHIKSNTIFAGSIEF